MTGIIINNLKIFLNFQIDSIEKLFEMRFMQAYAY